MFDSTISSQSVKCGWKPISLSRNDAIEVVNLARSFDVPELMPCAAYVCTLLSLSDLVLAMSTGRLSEYHLTSVLRLKQDIRDTFSLFCTRLLHRHSTFRPGSCFNKVRCAEAFWQFHKEYIEEEMNPHVSCQDLLDGRDMTAGIERMYWCAECKTLMRTSRKIFVEEVLWTKLCMQGTAQMLNH